MQKKPTVIMCPKNMTITVKDFVNGLWVTSEATEGICHARINVINMKNNKLSQPSEVLKTLSKSFQL